MRSATWPQTASRATGRVTWLEERIDTMTAGAAMCAAPLSIAVSESFLGIALAARMWATARGRAAVHTPRVFWFWVIWALVEIIAWLHSPELSAGKGEIRHLLLIATLFAILPALSAVQDKIRVWKGIFLTASLGSAAVIVGFFSRTIRYRQELAAGGDPAFYLRNGGLLHHWMIYATVEIVVFAALLEFRAAYPEARRWTQPALIVNSLAVVVSLTRSLWLACFVLVVAHLLWHRSRLVWLAPIVPLIALWAGPTSLRARVAVSFQPDYYSNAERVQMLRVGWKMIREQPLMGKGPGRVDKLYPSYLASGEPVPAYHGHLHNNAVQLAAQFGIPALAAAMLWLAVLVHELLRRCRIASAREEAFLARTAMMALGGFLLVGMTDYTYGHSLGLILVSFASLPPLTPRAD